MEVDQQKREEKEKGQSRIRTKEGEVENERRGRRFLPHLLEGRPVLLPGVDAEPGEPARCIEHATSTDLLTGIIWKKCQRPRINHKGKAIERRAGGEKSQNATESPQISESQNKYLSISSAEIRSVDYCCESSNEDEGGKRGGESCGRGQGRGRAGAGAVSRKEAHH